MDELVKDLAAKVGIDETTAQKVVAYLSENWDDIVKWVGADKYADVKEDIGEAVEGIKDKISGFFDKK